MCIYIYIHEDSTIGRARLILSHLSRLSQLSHLCTSAFKHPLYIHIYIYIYICMYIYKCMYTYIYNEDSTMGRAKYLVT